MRIEVGLSPLETRSPAALPTGTLPEAIPPIVTPSANGVRIDEKANAVSILIASRSLRAPARSA